MVYVLGVVTADLAGRPLGVVAFSGGGSPKLAHNGLRQKFTCIALTLEGKRGVLGVGEDIAAM